MKELLAVLEEVLPELEKAGFLDLHWKLARILRNIKQASGSPVSPASPPRGKAR